MKRLACLAIIFGLLIPSAICAAPFLICDPQTGVQYYVLTGPAWVPTNVVAQPDGSLKMDVATAPAGTSSLTVKACSDDPIWLTVCSTATPFNLVRPSLPLTPLGIKLIK